MCGRFTQKLTWRQIHDLYSLAGSALPLNLEPRYNGAPTQDFAACRLDDDGNRSIAKLRWGLVQRLGHLLVAAARVEHEPRPLWRYLIRNVASGAHRQPVGAFLPPAFPGA